jgi:hypothetical protein
MNGTPHPPAQQPAAGYDANARPRAVTSAAVIGFVLAGLIILEHLTFFFTSVRYIGADYSVGGAATGAGLAAIATAYLVIGLALSALLVWGAVAAFKGRTGIILIVVSVLTAIIYAVGAVGMLTGSRELGITVLDFILVVPILILILQPSSRAFFRAGGVTAT